MSEEAAAQRCPRRRQGQRDDEPLFLRGRVRRRDAGATATEAVDRLALLDKEIEVTPEMIVEGIDALMGFNVVESFNREEWELAVAVVFDATRRVELS